MRRFATWLIVGSLFWLPFSVSYAACQSSTTPFQLPCNAFAKFCFSIKNDFDQTVYLSSDNKTSQPLASGSTQYYVCNYPPAVKNTNISIYPTSKLSGRWVVFTYMYSVFPYQNASWVSYVLSPAILDVSVRAKVVNGVCTYSGPVEVIHHPPVQAVCQYSLSSTSATDKSP